MLDTLMGTVRYFKIVSDSRIFQLIKPFNKVMFDENNRLVTKIEPLAQNVL